MGPPAQHSLWVRVIICITSTVPSQRTLLLLVANVTNCCFQKPRLEHHHHLSPPPVSLPQEDILELKRQLSLADGQLRKSEVSRKRLEISNRKLLLFVQVRCGTAPVLQHHHGLFPSGFASPINFLLHKQEGFFLCLTLKSRSLLVRRKQGMNSYLLISLGAMQTPWCRFCWWLCSPWLPLLRLLQELCCQNHLCSPSLGIAEGCFSIDRDLESGFALPVLFPARISCKISQLILSVGCFSTSFPIFGIPVCVISKLASMGSISTECICYGYW